MPPQEQNQTPLVSQPPHNHKILWILLPVFILLAVAGLFVFKYQLSQKSEVNLVQNVATTTDEFAGWKTYRNEEYGFEFKHPDYLEVQLGENYNDLQWKVGKVGDKSNNWLKFDFQVIPPQASNVDTLFQNYKRYATYSNNEINKVENSDQGIYITYQRLPPYSYYKIVPDNYYLIEFNSDNDNYLRSEEFKKLSQSFNFFKPLLDISIWKIYKNDDYGFEFKYPTSWKIVNSYGKGDSEILTLAREYVKMDNRNPESFTGMCNIDFNILKNYRKFGESIMTWNERVKELDYNISTKEIEVGTRLGIRAFSEEAAYVGGTFLPVLYEDILSIHMICGGDVLSRGTLEYDQILSTFKFTN